MAMESKSPNLSPDVQDSLKRYWRSNLRVMTVLLGIWGLCGLGFGVVFVDALNEYKLGGYPLGFWFAQQGSIIVFVVLILVYARMLNRLDTKHHAEVESLKKGAE